MSAPKSLSVSPHEPTSIELMRDPAKIPASSAHDTAIKLNMDVAAAILIN